MRVRTAAVATLLMLTGCGKADQVAQDAAVPQEGEMAESVGSPRIALPSLVAEPAATHAPAPAGAQPRIAYAYTRQYRLAGDRIAPAQARHVALCDALGAARCRIVAMQRASADADYANGSLSLQVDARIARAFGDRLDRAVAGDGGSVAGSGIQAEDLSKDMTDTAARIRAKQALADRLMALLANRGAKVGELVEAERALAAAQEELDAARSWMSEMSTRVATSKYDLQYQAFSPSGDGWAEPVRRAFVESGRSFAASLGALIAFVVMALPWAALIAFAIWLLRRRGWRPRLRFWRRDPPSSD